jgi:hypothetical protein
MIRARDGFKGRAYTMNAPPTTLRGIALNPMPITIKSWKKQKCALQVAAADVWT